MKYSKKTLKNGLRIITVPIKSTKAVTVMVLVATGSDYENKEENGISHFLEHMCFQGTKNRPHTGDISKELDQLGAQSNAFTGKEYTGYWAKAQKKHFPVLVDIISDIYLNSIFDRESIEREKGVVIEEMKMYEDLPQVKVGEVFDSLLYGDQPAGWPIIGNEANVKNIDQNKLLAYRQKHYLASKTMVVVAGNVSEKKAVELITKSFSSIRTAKKASLQKTLESQQSPAVKIHFKETDQAHIVLGFRSHSLGYKDNHKIGVLETILGQGMSSRLFQKLRDELGICYYVRASNDAYLDRGHFSISSGVAKERVKEAIGAILSELEKIKSEIVAEKELLKAKELKIGNMYLSLETSDSFADFYSFQDLLGLKIRTPEEKAKKIQSVTSIDIKNVANRIFRKETINLAIVGPYKNPDEFSNLLNRFDE